MSQNRKTQKNIFTAMAFFSALAFAFVIHFAPVLEGKETPGSANTNRYNETARFLAGRSVDKASSLYAYTQTKYYKNYTRQLNDGWNKFQKPNLNSMTAWWKRYAPAKVEKNVLYPFSGPDIMNVLAFFPNNETYTMFGLELPGIVPDPYGISEDKIRAGLNGVMNSLNSILNVNFFRTRGMEKELGNDSFNSICGLIMIFLIQNDCDIVSARTVAINAKSELVAGEKSDVKITWQNPPASKRIPGVEISFRKGNGPVQVIRYFMLNVIDYSLEKNSPNFIPYIDKGAPYMTFIKSASYLMHNDDIKFTKIRAMVIADSSFIAQDDSGVPLRYLPASKWDLGFHGVYDKPIALFANRGQKDLKEAFAKQSTGVLPFSYGYNAGKGQSNLMTARKK